ncbi:MAG: polymer-forming cytoskeletal protein [SAR324 cluster bacterium]|nr:polymer-forming cytoskeletal protein [SAR324 cluster bacterium]
MKVISSYIASDVHIEGTITCNGSARIDGNCRGTILGKNEITIGTMADIDGKINARSIVINGKIKGDLVAESTITLLSEAEVVGNFYSPPGGISIFQGGKLDGSFHLIKTPIISDSYEDSPS